MEFIAGGGIHSHKRTNKDPVVLEMWDTKGNSMVEERTTFATITRYKLGFCSGLA